MTTLRPYARRALPTRPILYPRVRTCEAVAAAAPAIPLPFRMVTRTTRRARIGVVGAFGFAGAAACLMAAARAFWATGLAMSAVPTTTRPSSSRVATPAATTAIVRQG